MTYTELQARYDNMEADYNEVDESGVLESIEAMFEAGVIEVVYGEEIEIFTENDNLTVESGYEVLVKDLMKIEAGWK